MDFSPDSELENIASEARKLAGQFDDEYWSAKDVAHEFPWEYYNAFAEGGWLGIIIPEQYGGAGLGILHAGTLLGAVSSCGGAMSAAATLRLEPGRCGRHDQPRIGHAEQLVD